MGWNTSIDFLQSCHLSLITRGTGIFMDSKNIQGSINKKAHIKGVCKDDGRWREKNFAKYIIVLIFCLVFMQYMVKTGRGKNLKNRAGRRFTGK